MIANSMQHTIGCASDKSAIRQAFSKAANTYDQHAEFQRQVGHLLLEKLPCNLSGEVIVDLGCGTGYFSQQLLARGAEVICVDISPQMLLKAQQRCGNANIHYVCMDAESLCLPAKSVDYVFSSLALQWCHRLETPFAQIRRVLKPNGQALFATLMEGSLHELKTAWRKVDQYQHVNHFHSHIQVKIALAQAECERYHLNWPNITMWYPSAFELMRDLKGIGANHVSGRASGLTSRRTLLELEQAYQEVRNDKGLLPATYHLCLGVIYR